MEAGVSPGQRVKIIIIIRGHLQQVLAPMERSQAGEVEVLRLLMEEEEVVVNNS